MGRRNGFFYMAVGVKWAGPGFQVFLRGCPRGSSCGIGRLLTVISMCDRTFFPGPRVVVFRLVNWCRGGRLREEAAGN